MRSSATSHGLPALTAENILNYMLEIKHTRPDDKTKQAIETALTSKQDLITLNELINKVNEAKETINLLHGLTMAQKTELKQLINREKEFKLRHHQHTAQHDDYRQFIIEQHKILPLQQMITWWDNNHDAFMKDEFWEKITHAATIQSARRKESDKRKRRRLHRLLDVREDFKQYEAYYGFTGEDLLQFNSNYLDFLADIILKLQKNRRAYPVMISEYLSVILRAIENEKRLIIYSMIYRFQCAEYYKDKTCDDLMTYTCDRIYHYASLHRDEKKIQPPKRCGLTPTLSIAFKKHIQEYAAKNPNDKLVSHKIKEILVLSPPADHSSAAQLETAIIASQQAINASAPADHLTPDLGRLILSIEDMNHLLINQQSLTPENITAFLARFYDEILIPIDKILLSINQPLEFRHLMQFKLVLQYCLQPTLKKLILSANQSQLEGNPYWYHLVNHFGSRKDMNDLNTLVANQETSPQFNQMLEFAIHFNQSKQRLNQEIQAHLLQEAGLTIHAEAAGEIKLSALLQTSEIKNEDLITLWTACAKKLKLNHVLQHYDLVYAMNMVKYLGKITHEILRRSASDPVFCNHAIKTFALLDDIKPDLEICLQQEARTNRFHYLFSGRIDQQSLLKPFIQAADKIYALQLANRLDGYIKDYTRFEQKRAIMTKLRAKCTDIIENKCSPLSLADEIDAALNDASANSKLSGSYRFKRRLTKLSGLSKQYFTPVNARVQVTPLKYVRF